MQKAGTGIMTFQTELILGGKTATGIEVPEAVVTALGKGKRPPVKVTINGHTYRSTIAVMGGAFMLPVNAEVRENAGIAAGDLVEVAVELDNEPREVDVPADLQEALSRDDDARSVFEALSYSNKRRIVLQIEEAKTPETRQRRIDKTVSTLRDGRS